MVKKILYVCFVFVMIALLPFVITANTELTIKTLPEYKVSISVLTPNEVYSLIESFHKYPDSNGEVKVNFSTNLNEVDIAIWLKSNRETIFHERKESYNTGDKIFINLLSEEEPKINISETNETEEQANLTEETEEIILPEETFEQETESNTNQSITGFSVFGENVKSNYIYYILGFLLITGFVIFFTIRKNCRHKQGTEQEPTTIKLSELKESDNKRLENAEKKLAEAEQELRQAQSEINEIKNKGNKIQEAEQEFKRAKERLDGLREGFEQKEPRQDSLSGYNRNNSTI